MLWSSLSKTISPLSSLLTFIVLSFLLSLKLQGLQEHFIPLGSIEISFLICNLQPHIGQSKVINLLVSFCSSSRFIVVGSSSDSSKSSGIGCFLILLLIFGFTFFGGIYIILKIIYNYLQKLQHYPEYLFKFIIFYNWKWRAIYLGIFFFKFREFFFGFLPAYSIASCSASLLLCFYSFFCFSCFSLFFCFFAFLLPLLFFAFLLFLLFFAFLLFLLFFLFFAFLLSLLFFAFLLFSLFCFSLLFCFSCFSLLFCFFAFLCFFAFP